MFDYYSSHFSQRSVTKSGGNWKSVGSSFIYRPIVILTDNLASYSITLLALFNDRISINDHSRNASARISTSRAGTPVRIEENLNSSRTWSFADYFVGRPSVATSDVKSAPPFIVSFDQQRNLEEFSPSRSSNASHHGQPRPFSIPSPQYPQALGPSLRRRIEVPLSASLRAKTTLSRISSFGLPIRPLPRTPSR